MLEMRMETGVNSYVYWIYADRGDFLECCPIEFDENGAVDSIIGLALITSLDDMKERADRIWKVDDIDTAEHPVPVWNRTDVNGETV